MIACPACGARNSESAEWCTLCAVRLGSPAPDVAVPAPTPVPQATAHREPTPADDTDGEPRWTCRVCGGVNPLSENLCATCATSIFEAHGAQEERELDRRRASRRQYIPGAGYAALGDLATGAMQLAVLGLAMLFAVLLFSGGERVGGAACLLAGSVVWGMGAVDVAGRLEGRSPLLNGGRLLGAALVIVVIVLVVTMGSRGA